MGHPRGKRTTTKSRDLATPQDAALRLIRRLEGGSSWDAAVRDLRKEWREADEDRIHRAIQWTRRYFRWRGALAGSEPKRASLDEAFELDQRFAEAPQAFPDKILFKSLPRWAPRQLTLTANWVRGLQAAPSTWLRFRGERPLDESYVSLSEWLARSEDFRGPGVPEGTLASPAFKKWLAAHIGAAFIYTGEDDPFRMKAFEAGAFEIQDIASQIAALCGEPKPGEKWWDVCAGEGGKTLAIAEIMKNKGVVWASDRADWRLARLKKRAKRAKVFNIQIGDPTTLPAEVGFDGVLVDAPCTGIGVWGKRPEARWRLEETAVEELAQTQLALLDTAARRVKKRGQLVYSVCTLSAKETEDVVRAFQETHPEFEPTPVVPNLEPTLRIEPGELNGIGMFIAKWRRKAS